MFAVMGIPVTVGGFFGAVAQMSMVPCLLQTPHTCSSHPFHPFGTLLPKKSFQVRAVNGDCLQMC